MLHLILADSELETVPPEISSEKSIKWKAQRRGRKPTELILDSNYDHRVMRKLSDSERRGRPDIIHVCMLAALDSPLNREGLLQLYIHTRNDEIIDVNPETRIPRSYNRFVGLMEQLFLTSEVPPEKPLLCLRDGTLAELVKEINPKKTITFSGQGRKLGYRPLYGGLEKDEDACVIVGGFPHGDFLSGVRKLSDEIVKIYPEELEALTAITHAIHFYESEFEVLEESLRNE